MDNTVKVVEIDQVKEKLIVLISKVQDNGKRTECTENSIVVWSPSNAELADHLIANGVTLDNQVSSSKWISVKDRLPDKYQLVLAACKNGKIFVGEYVDLGWRTLWRIRTARDSTKEITQIVTHWMPLPEPPKGD